MPIELKSILQVNRQESLKKWLEIIKDQHASGLSALACCKEAYFSIKKPAMERDHPAKLQMNLPSSIAPQRSFLICASATMKRGAIKSADHTLDDLALTELHRYTS